MQASVLSSSNKLTTSPKSSFGMKRKRFLGGVVRSQQSNLYQEQEALSQSEVVWGNDSPKRPLIKIPNHEEQSFQNTPVRITKKAMSSPMLLTNNQPNSGNLFKFEKMLNEGLLAEKKPLNTKQFLDFTSEDFDMDDEAILFAVEEIEKESNTQMMKKSENIFDNSIDDAFLATIPLEMLSSQSTSHSKEVNLVYDSKVGLSQVISEKKNLPKLTSDPVKSSITQTQTGLVGTKREPLAKTNFGRHNSLPSPTQNRPNSSNLTKALVDNPRTCTKAEIAEKKRLAMERLKKTQEANKKRKM